MTCSASNTLPLLATFTAGDLLPIVVGVLRDVDITGYTITLHVQRPSPNAVLIKTANIVDAAQGKFEIEWEEGDLVTGLGQLCEMQFVDPDDKPLTSKKFTIDVEPEIA